MKTETLKVWFKIFKTFGGTNWLHAARFVGVIATGLAILFGLTFGGEAVQQFHFKGQGIYPPTHSEQGREKTSLGGEKREKTLTVEVPLEVKRKLFEKAVKYYKKGNYVGALELFLFIKDYGNSTLYVQRLKEFFLSPPSADLFRGKEPFVRMKIAGDFKEIKIECPSGKVFDLVADNNAYALENRLISEKLFLRAGECSVTFDGKKEIRFPKGIKLLFTFYKKRPIAVAFVPLELYLAGVLPGEVYMSWNDETLKAQAVAARTFALYNMAKRKSLPFDVDTSTTFQHFAGFEKISPKALRVVNETRGEVITYKGRLIYAMYSANTGGCTHSFKELFGIDLPYLTTVKPERFCDMKLLKRSFWTGKMEPAEISRFLNNLGFQFGKTCDVKVSKRNPCGRGLLITFEDFSGRKITLPLSFFVRFQFHLPSDWFYIEKGGRLKVFLLRGRGFGHGLGMGQWEAYCLGKKGWNYKRILEFFYPKTRVEKIY